MPKLAGPRGVTQFQRALAGPESTRVCIGVALVAIHQPLPRVHSSFGLTQLVLADTGPVERLARVGGRGIKPRQIEVFCRGRLAIALTLRHTGRLQQRGRRAGLLIKRAGGGCVAQPAVGDGHADQHPGAVAVLGMRVEQVLPFGQRAGVFPLAEVGLGNLQMRLSRMVRRGVEIAIHGRDAVGIQPVAQQDTGVGIVIQRLAGGSQRIGRIQRAGAGLLFGNRAAVAVQRGGAVTGVRQPLAGPLLQLSAVAGKLTASHDGIQLRNSRGRVAAVVIDASQVLLRGKEHEVVGSGCHCLVESRDRCVVVTGFQQVATDAQVDLAGQRVVVGKIAAIGLDRAGRVADLTQRLTNPEVDLDRQRRGRRLLARKLQGDHRFGGLLVFEIGQSQPPARLLAFRTIRLGLYQFSK